MKLSDRARALLESRKTLVSLRAKRGNLAFSVKKEEIIRMHKACSPSSSSQAPRNDAFWQLLAVPMLAMLALLPVPLLAASLTLSWNANKEPDLHSYSIHYGTVSRDTTVDPADFKYQQIASNITDTTITISGLTTGSKYYFSATARDSAMNESAFSDEVSTMVAGIPGQTLDLGGRNRIRGVTTRTVKGAVYFSYVLGPEQAGQSATLKLFDNQGRLLRKITATPASPGMQQMAWNRKTSQGHTAGMGAYFYELSIGESRFVDKLVIGE